MSDEAPASTRKVLAYLAVGVVLCGVGQWADQGDDVNLLTIMGGLIVFVCLAIFVRRLTTRRAN